MNSISKSTFFIQEGILFFTLLFFHFSTCFFVFKIFKGMKVFRRTFFEENLFKKITQSIREIIWVIGLTYMLRTLFLYINAETLFISRFFELRNLIIIFFCSKIAFQIKKHHELSWTKQQNFKKHSYATSRIGTLFKLISLTLLVLTALMVLQALGLKIDILMTLGSVGGIIIGFASQDIIANYFTGFMIYLSRPFKVGDCICTPDESLYGNVEDIGYYMTLVRGRDLRPYYIPNSFFASKMMINVSRCTHKLLVHIIALQYKDLEKVNEITAKIQLHLEGNSKIDQSLGVLVAFQAYAQSSLEILVRYFSLSKDRSIWLKTQQEVLISINEIIHQTGANVAYKTETLNFSQKRPSDRIAMMNP